MAGTSTAEFASSVLFRTADGRSLFAETLGVTENARVYSGGLWRGGRSRRREEGVLGDEACGSLIRKRPGSKRLGLGLSARLRRGRIDVRSRDEKRMEEILSARGRIKRLEDEVGARNGDSHNYGAP